MRAQSRNKRNQLRRRPVMVNARLARILFKDLLYSLVQGPLYTLKHIPKAHRKTGLIMPALSCPNATNAPLRFLHNIFYPPPNLSAALFNISAVFLIILAASSQSFFSIASLAKGKTAVSSALLASGAKMACLNWSRPGSCSH
jgi:hypothetical protein